MNADKRCVCLQMVDVGVKIVFQFIIVSWCISMLADASGSGFFFYLFVAHSDYGFFVVVVVDLWPHCYHSGKVNTEDDWQSHFLFQSKQIKDLKTEQHKWVGGLVIGFIISNTISIVFFHAAAAAVWLQK